MSSPSPWDWEKSFRMHEAAALIAGVPVSPKRCPDLEELHPGVKPVLKRLATAWAIGDSYRKGGAISAEYPLLETLAVEAVFPGESVTGLLIKRAELHRWIKEIGLPSIYDFGEPTTVKVLPQVVTALEKEPPPQTDIHAGRPVTSGATVMVAQPLQQRVDCDASTDKWLTTPQVATVFDGLPFSGEVWPKRLSDAKWLTPARKSTGQRGGPPAMWCPLLLAKSNTRQASGRQDEKGQPGGPE